MRKPLLKWKYICIKPDSILQSGIIKTAIYKMKNHITRIHFEKCHNKGGFCGNGRTWTLNYILQWAIIKFAEHTYRFIRNNKSFLWLVMQIIQSNMLLNCKQFWCHSFVVHWKSIFSYWVFIFCSSTYTWSWQSYQWALFLNCCLFFSHSQDSCCVRCRRWRRLHKGPQRVFSSNSIFLGLFPLTSQFCSDSIWSLLTTPEGQRELH